MNLRQAAYWLAVIPLLALVVTLGAVVGAPRQVLPTLKGLTRRLPPRPPTDDAPVTGLVTKDGQPVAKATVQFHDANGRVVTVTTDSEGRYTASPSEAGEGVILASPRNRLVPVTVEAEPLNAKPEDGGKPVLEPIRKVTVE
jgi:hypothetical protein